MSAVLAEARSAAAPEHEFEAAHGLPEPLPAGERILWQGAPEFLPLLERVFHARTLAAYFALILLARAITVWTQGGGLGAAALAALWLLPVALTALGLVALMASLTARSTVYTITDRRVVMRVGIVLTVTFNLPFARIEAAAVRPARAGSGDIALALGGADRIAYLHLWPHVRPWRVRRTEPMLRCIGDAARVGQLLRDAWCAAHDLSAIPVPVALAPRPAATSQPPATAGRRAPALSAVR
ncbi:MAG TPA: photosynthetic complex putative assembly protein PuhB [Caldimonas sp.]|nr:photosynthetic complex putative assembly protein PuhB [Caldimonas sp.]